MGYPLTNQQPTQLSGHTSATISVVIPTMNAFIPPFLSATMPTWVDEVLIVVGDNAQTASNRLIPLPPQARMIRHPGYSKQSALYTGLRAATSDIILVMSGDGTHDPKEIVTFCALLLTGSDYVIGSRFIQGGKSTQLEYPRRLRNWVLTTVARICFGGNYSDLCYGYIGFWRRLLPKLELDMDQANGDENLIVVMNLRALRYGFNVAEVPSCEKATIH